MLYIIYIIYILFIYYLFYILFYIISHLVLFIHARINNTLRYRK